MPELVERQSNAGLRIAARVSKRMQNAAYYRERAERVRWLAKQGADSVYEELMRLARDFDELADDLLHGAIEIRHPELMPQRQRRQTDN